MKTQPAPYLIRSAIVVVSWVMGLLGLEAILPASPTMAAPDFGPAPGTVVGHPLSDNTSMGPQVYAYLYQPRIRYGGGQLVENTDFGANNPDISNNYSTCFGQTWNILYHAGIDYYDVRQDANIAGAGGIGGRPVYSIANGTIVTHTNDLYPGRAIVIQHQNPTGGTFFAVYMHLNELTVSAPIVTPGSAGVPVSRGTLLGYVRQLNYAGSQPQYHANADDSHLHFEIRNFGDPANIPCPGLGWPGAGYRYPIYPTSNQASSGPVKVYFDPEAIIGANQYRQLAPGIGR